MINRSIVTMGTKYSLLRTFSITNARLEFAMRLLLGLYAGADAWMHFMTPIVKKKKGSVVQTIAPICREWLYGQIRKVATSGP